MSIKGSRSRVSDKKKFDDHFDDIDFSKGRKEPTEVVEGATNELYGKVKRYYYGERKNYKKGDAPAIGGFKSTAEKSLSDL